MSLYQKYKDNFRFIDRNKPVADAVHAFRKACADGKVLDAILVTEHGKPEETPINLFTVADLPKMYDLLEV